MTSPIITPITQTFASTRGDNVLPGTTPSDIVANQPNGFPVDQMLPPTNPSWQAVKEQEMNGVFNFYTNQIFQQGQGLQYTFDSALSTAIGGYPQGIILYCASNNTYQQSLVANNTANFVTTPSFINDGINWATFNDFRAGNISQFFVGSGFAVILNSSLLPNNNYIATLSGVVTASGAGTGSFLFTLDLTTSFGINNIVVASNGAASLSATVPPSIFNATCQVIGDFLHVSGNTNASLSGDFIAFCVCFQWN